MKTKITVLAISMTLALAGCAGNSGKVGPNGEKLANNGKICKFEKTTGSNIGRKVCRTPEQIEYERQAANELLRDVQRSGPVGEQ